MNNNQNEITIEIKDDVYEQKDTFNIIISLINEYIKKEFCHDGTLDSNLLEMFYQKVMDSTVLILINEEVSNVSSEEIYVDINHKAQHLDVEDIFKGYCFKKVRTPYDVTVKEKWVKLKCNSFYFRDKFGMDDFSNFLYVYFLTEYCTPKLKEKLELDDKHILDDKSMNEVLIMLENIELFGSSIKDFYEYFQVTNNKFQDYVHNYNNQEFIIKRIKNYCDRIMTHPDKYQKLPFFVFVTFLSSLVRRNSRTTLELFDRTVTMYYLYSVIFSRVIVKQKSKNIVLYEHIGKIKSLIIDEDIDGAMNEIKKDIKRNCKEILKSDEHYQIKKKFDYDASIGLYSFIDNYCNNKEVISKLYTREEQFNDEHLIISEKKCFLGVKSGCF